MHPAEHLRALFLGLAEKIQDSNYKAILSFTIIDKDGFSRTSTSWTSGIEEEEIEQYIGDLEDHLT